LSVGRKLCPEVEFAPHTAEGRLVLAALDRPGVWRFAAFTGALIGLDLAEAMASLPQGIDRERARALFIAAEIAFVRAFHKRKDSEHA
jgi:hypothetical protein